MIIDVSLKTYAINETKDIIQHLARPVQKATTISHTTHKDKHN
jgi:hypothetical protein